VHRLHALLPVVERGFDSYDYAISREALDQFFWTEFADDYVELVKDRFWTEESYSDEQRASARSTLWETLRTLLALYAPFLPFITEELYQYMYRQHENVPSIHVSSWPETPAEPAPEVPEIELVRGVPRAVRSERTRTGLPQGRPLQELVVEVTDDEVRATLEAMTQSLAAAARAREIRFGSAATETAIPGVRIDIVPEEKKSA